MSLRRYAGLLKGAWKKTRLEGIPPLEILGGELAAIRDRFSERPADNRWRPPNQYSGSATGLLGREKEVAAQRAPAPSGCATGYRHGAGGYRQPVWQSRWPMGSWSTFQAALILSLCPR